ncbi:MAG: hypothetical protein J7M18_07035 [Candidatus Eremiobacteraeota bacterium]|nr:hypothetical protein [Candidatus Eremiobacteraeota bacterium]
MKRTCKIIGWMLLFVLVLLIYTTQQADAQIILVNEKFKVVKVDVPKNRLEVVQLIDPKNKTITYVIVDGHTRCSTKGKPADWKDIKPGMIIRVKGGMRLDMKIKAKKIYW